MENFGDVTTKLLSSERRPVTNALKSSARLTSTLRFQSDDTRSDGPNTMDRPFGLHPGPAQERNTL
jgi:hypothetical protein